MDQMILAEKIEPLIFGAICKHSLADYRLFSLVELLNSLRIHLKESTPQSDTKLQPEPVPPIATVSPSITPDSSNHSNSGTKLAIILVVLGFAIFLVAE